MRFFTSDFFTDRFLSSPLRGISRLSEFGFEFGEIFTISDWLSAVIYSGESILPVMFTTERCDSPHHFGGESPFVSIICTNSSCCLIRRVDTPHIVYYGESLLPASFIAGSHCWQRRVVFKNFEGLPLPLKGQWSKKSAIHVQHHSPRAFQKSQKYGLPKALFLTIQEQITPPKFDKFRNLS